MPAVPYVVAMVLLAVVVVALATTLPQARRTEAGIVLLGVLLLVEAFVLFHLLVEIWPAVERATAPTTASTGTPGERSYRVELFGSAVDWQVSADSALLVMVLAVGALGAHLHASTSYALHLAWRDFGSWWIWWYVLRPIVGAGLAAILYFVVRGGLVSVSTQTDDVNAYGLAAFAALAGLFSTPAMKRLQSVFTSVLGNDATDGIEGPVAKRVEPATVAAGAVAPVVEIRGSGFVEGAYADVEGRRRDAEWLDASRVRVTFAAEDVSGPGELRISVVNPDRKRSHDVRVTVE